MWGLGFHYDYHHYHHGIHRTFCLQQHICIIGHETIVVPGVVPAVVVLFSVADVAFSLVVAAAHRLLCSL